LQRLPDAAPRNVDQTMDAIVRSGAAAGHSEKAA
jgi:hypothetical protein